MKIFLLVLSAVVACGMVGCSLACDKKCMSENNLMHLSVEDTLIPVRPGGEGRPFWNRYAIQFIYAPAFEFAKIRLLWQFSK